MVLRRIPGRKVWIAQGKVKDSRTEKWRTYSKSTQTRNKTEARKAERDIRKIISAAKTSQRAGWTLLAAHSAEVDLVKLELGAGAAARVESSLSNFLAFIGDVPLQAITNDRLAAYQRARLAGPVRERRPPKEIRENKSPKEIADWVKKHPLPAASRSSMMKERSHITRMLRRHGLDPQWPKIGVAAQSTGRAFTKKELEALFAACTPEYRCLYTLILATGARPAELIPSVKSSHVPLQKEEIDFEASTVVIRTAKQKPGQPAKKRIVPIPAELLPLLRGQMQRHIGTALFASQSNLARNFDALLKRAGIAKRNALGEKLTAHCLRNTHATLLNAQRESPFDISARLGHSRLSTTSGYVNPSSVTLNFNFGDLLGAAATDTGAEIIEVI